MSESRHATVSFGFLVLFMVVAAAVVVFGLVTINRHLNHDVDVTRQLVACDTFQSRINSDKLDVALALIEQRQPAPVGTLPSQCEQLLEQNRP